MHFNRTTLATVLILHGVADAQMPERVRATPVIVGRVTRNKAPVADARMAVVLYEAGKTQPRDGCGSPWLPSRTSNAGGFRIGSEHIWLKAGDQDALAKSATNRRHQFVVCARLAGEERYRVIFKAPALRWDTLHLACELARTWLPPDREGRQGYCEAERAAVDGQPLAERPARDRLSDVTCDTTDATLGPLRIGPVKVGGSVEQLRRLCPSLRDTSVQGEGWLEPSAQRAMVLTVAGTPVIIHPSAGQVAQISIRTPGLKTPDGIGVGTAASRMHAWTSLHVVAGSTDLLPYAVAWTGDECGTGFYMTQPDAPKVGNEWQFVQPAQLRAWHDTFTVRRIVVGICPQYTWLRKG